MASSPSNDILRLHSGAPLLNKVSVLILGEYGINKKKLAESLVSMSDKFPLLVRLTSNLPLEPTDPPRPRIDFICFVIDVTRKESLNCLQEAVKLIDAEYFLGKACLIVHQPDNHPKLSTIEIESIKDIAKMYNLIIIYGNIETRANHVSCQILRIVEISAGFKSNLQSIFLLALT
ncbi:Hypothetical predicted protein [Octopus vulgaris]|uniref:Uncharacterized protein n=2 Tax=Octopus TaxID=6643 RepID=A0AA36F5A3_OCTVU|nr:centromere protein M-like [Octopus sinensis]CAI9724580.1 Hypothetical predicted protein [Octopus vulgaris]